MINGVRLATEEDAQQMLDIYSPYIEKTSLTFEKEIPSLEAFRQRIETYLVNWPWLVYESNGIIGGYAYGARYRERAGYQWCVETSIYIHDDFHQKGIAKDLYKILLNILRTQGYRNAYAVINLPNDRSVKFHEAAGFSHFATYENVGYKLGKWKNVGWWQLQLNNYDHEPIAPIRFSELSNNSSEVR